MKLCNVVNCAGIHRSKGFCNKHYQRWIKKGDPVKGTNVYGVKKCKIDQCIRKHMAKGLCQKHYDVEYWMCNSNKRKQQHKKWVKENPIKVINIMQRHLIKHGSTFNMGSMEYLYCLTRWAKLVKELDNHMCKLCGSKENLNAHHIQPKQDFPELSLDLDNGITLCKKCHGKTHGFNILTYLFFYSYKGKIEILYYVLL